MGLKLVNHRDVSTIPAQCINGVLSYTFGGKVYETVVPELKTQEFKLQRNAYLSENILAYLANETYKIVFYFSGVCCIMLKNTLFKRFNYTLPELPNLEIVAGIPVIQSNYSHNNLSSICKVYKERGTNYAIMYGTNGNTAVEFNIDENIEFVSDFKAPVVYPSMIMENGRLVKQHEPGTSDYVLEGVIHYGEIIII